MTGTIKINGAYGAKIGNIQVFTYEGAVNAYKNFCKLFNRDMSIEASVVQDAAAEELYEIVLLSVPYASAICCVVSTRIFLYSVTVKLFIYLLSNQIQLFFISSVSRVFLFLL